MAFLYSVVKFFHPSWVQMTQNIAKKIAEKENAYETLYTNLTAAVLPPDVIQDISLRMQKLKESSPNLCVNSFRHIMQEAA